MKRSVILLIGFCALLTHSNKINAQCSTLGTGQRSANCISNGTGSGVQQDYYIPSGISITISDHLIAYAEYSGSGVEADAGTTAMWWDNISTVGETYGGTTFSSSDNDDGYLYLTASSSVNAYAEIDASW